jgi:hypothetical protein
MKDFWCRWEEFLKVIIFLHGEILGVFILLLLLEDTC